MSDRASLLQDREVRRQVQQRFLDIYDEVKAELMRIPGVTEVGVGLREKDGKLTSEPAFRVYVTEKRPLSEIPPDQVIPTEIRGFPIDVITHRQKIPCIGFKDENDTTNYKTKPGGARIGVDEVGSGQGTLGCFARLNSDNSIVLLSCFHVLMQDEYFHNASPGTDNNKGVGQPDYSGSWCCVCNEIAKTLKGDKNLDCAIAKLKDKVKFAPKIKKIVRGDGTTEEAGFIEGSDAPVQFDEVWKVGARTGLTRGKLSQVTPTVEIQPIAPFTYFADHGDSGSAVVDKLSGKVVALLNSIDKEIVDGGTLGYATPIGPITTLMGITILTTDEGQDYDVREWPEEYTVPAPPPTPEEVFSGAADRLSVTKGGQELLALVQEHRKEIAHLVNHCRPVTVVWQRSQGPAYMAALMRTAREPIYRLPQTLNGVDREEVARHMGEALIEHGSNALREAVLAHREMFSRLWLECQSFDEFVDAWECEEHFVSK